MLDSILSDVRVRDQRPRPFRILHASLVAVFTVAIGPFAESTNVYGVDESFYRVRLVSDIRPGPVKSNLSELTVYQDELIFAA